MFQDFDVLHHHEYDLNLPALQHIVGANPIEYASISFSAYQSYGIEYFGFQEFTGTAIGVGTTKCYQCYLDIVFVSFLRHAWWCSKQAEDSNSAVYAMATSDCYCNSLYYYLYE